VELVKTVAYATNEALAKTITDASNQRGER